MLVLAEYFELAKVILVLYLSYVSPPGASRFDDYYVNVFYQLLKIMFNRTGPWKEPQSTLYTLPSPVQSQ